MLRMMGPPPRTRGTRSHPGRDAQRTGTTPAYAGNAVGRASRWSWGRDHPRVRGERGRGTRQLFVPWGPPPRTRGTRQVRDHELAAHGTTPAYAGNASPPTSPAALTWDHPRVRGEREPNDKDALIDSGPPPRTRGTRRVAGRDRTPAGTTPAYAGNAPGTWPGGAWVRDHPRVRGERTPGPNPVRYPTGPPPRTRGTRAAPVAADGSVGTTPAYAGNAPGSAPSARAPRDHPRVRGERTAAPNGSVRLPGPPPRTRGTRVPG